MRKFSFAYFTNLSPEISHFFEKIINFAKIVFAKKKSAKTMAARKKQLWNSLISKQISSFIKCLRLTISLLYFFRKIFARPKFSHFEIFGENFFSRVKCKILAKRLYGNGLYLPGPLLNYHLYIKMSAEN